MTSINKKRLILFLLLIVTIILLLNSIKANRYLSGSDDINTPLQEKVETNNLSGFNQVALGSLAAYDAIVEKPLFVVGRNVVIDKKEVAQKGNIEVPDLVLIGVVITPDSEVAMLSDMKTKKFITLKTGDEFKGWKLSEILNDKVVFNTQERSHELLLHAEESKKPINRSRPRRK